ncbi:hypothetical protein [Cronobacter sakazakii]|uniref:hypothetical protein n=1 Tax=Cronobacter sakazakii TaxID=28141 RepID=UPI0028962206|nr:hypothetical protein [Cronobacter sakazakii]ELY2536564.1 hypothetical protein [Cronobacter sakazakii]ELY2540625.1 hypothetical protein [Cronobacter sakazakii]ELY4823303.1 hypothetical protein [Cronobacter sakazakii]ELY4839661.1 hypothetical protein [Cronobacter sakazakii]ELY5865315.1 hypothetical protein [Cronobacter sakazakii]
MNKSIGVIRFFNQITHENDALKKHSQSLIQSMHDYLSLHEEVKHCVESNLDKSDASFHIKPFDLTIFYRGSYKLYELDADIMSYCYEMSFFHKKNDDEVMDFTAYITADEYLVPDPSKTDTICQVFNENRGARVFARILNKLYENKVITV